MNKDTNSKISQALGIDPIQLPAIKEPPAEGADLVAESKTKLDILRAKPLEEIIIDEDFNEARDNLKGLIQKQQDAIDTLTLLADESESARHYEVLAVMFKNLSDMNDKLLNLSKQRKELTKGMPVQRGPHEHSVSEQKIEVQNAVFVGTSSDLDDLLEQRRNNKNIEKIIENDMAATSTIQTKE